jgi:hypothetical protein
VQYDGGEESSVVMTEDELIAKHIHLNVRREGPDEAMVGESAPSMWAVITQWLYADGDIKCVQEAYGLSEEEVRAALAYYRKHKPVIDARLLLNQASS